MKPESNINSYGGADDDAKKANRTWFHGEYGEVWPCLPEMEDLSGKAMTVEQSLRLLGRPIRSKRDCESFFNDSMRNELIKECKRWYRVTAITIYPDQFNRRVTDEGMRKENNERFSAISTAKAALEEWDEVARNKENWRLAQTGNLELQHLMTWESEIYIPEINCYMDYCVFRQPKRKKK
jgi:uncharacterized protein YqeY